MPVFQQEAEDAAGNARVLGIILGSLAILVTLHCRSTSCGSCGG